MFNAHHEETSAKGEKCIFNGKMFFPVAFLM